MKNKFKAFFLEIYYFLSSKIFLKNVAIMLGISMGGILLLFWVLSKYTLQGDYVKVPDLQKQSLQRASDLLELSELRIIVSDSSYDSKLPASTILEQIPAPGSKVKRNRTIYVKINQRAAPEVSISYSDIVGKPLQSVKRKLSGVYKLRVQVRYTKGRAKNTIAQLSYDGKVIFRDMEMTGRTVAPKEPYRIPQGATVELLVYEGKEAENKTVPDVTCLEYGKAEGIIRMSNFVVAEIRVSGAVTDSSKAIIRRQDPLGGEKMSMGGGINLWLDVAPVAGCEEERNEEDFF